MPTQYPELFRELTAPFPPAVVKKRKQGGKELDYVTARTVANWLDEKIGQENWWDEIAPLPSGKGFLCKLTLRFPDGSTVTKCDVGGDAGMSDEGDDEKSGASDAFKRAAFKWGIGRYLYGDGAPAVKDKVTAEVERLSSEANDRVQIAKAGRALVTAHARLYGLVPVEFMREFLTRALREGKCADVPESNMDQCILYKRIWDADPNWMEAMAQETGAFLVNLARKPIEIPPPVVYAEAEEAAQEAPATA